MLQRACRECLTPSSIGPAAPYTDKVAKTPRRFLTRACAVCEWTGASVEPAPAHSTVVECPWCHAPTRIVREEWLFDVSEMRAQAAGFGRLGGLKGGRSRAERLSARRRSDIARKAAAARWKRR
jgi:hypothetical protein